MQKEEKSYNLIVDLEYIESLDRYQPAPYLVKIQEDGTLGSMKAKVVKDNILSFNINLEDNIAHQVLELTERLSLTNLEAKYSTSSKKPNSFLKLFESAQVKKTIILYFDRIMDTLMLFLLKHSIPLVLNIERKIRLEALKIEIMDRPLKPILHFNKTQLGIKYSLQVMDDLEVPWSPFHKDVHVLSNDPTWVLVNYKIRKVESINGNKLKPFLKKDHIFVKNEMVRTYFEKFVIEVARKVDIQTTGFEVIQNSDILACRLSTTYDFIQDVLLLDLIFDYEGISFSYGSPAKNKSNLDISKDGNDISIHQVKRNSEEEEAYVDKLQRQFPFERTSSKRFHLTDGDDVMGLVGFMSREKTNLQSLGFEIDEPVIDGKKVVLDEYSIHIRQESKMDWFDVFGVVKIGDLSVPFAHLLENIRSGNRFYKLHNDKYFMIPLLWMTKYEELAKFGERKDDAIRIKRSQFTLLDNLGENAGNFNHSLISEEEIDYIPSSNLKAELRPYQIEGVKWLIKHQKNGLGACLADDMGLGKTLQTIAVLSYTKDRLKRSNKSSNSQLTLFAQEMLEEVSPLRALIILPSSLVFNWYQEIRKFNPTLHTLRFVGPTRTRTKDHISRFDIVLTTYHTVLRDLDLMASIEWEYIILDESQMIKNKEAKLFKSIVSIPALNKISLSGTPIENSLSDLWSQMEFINSDMLGNYPFFKKHFETPIEKNKDEDALLQLSKLINPYILRRTKEQVAKDLPPLSESIEVIEMSKTQKTIYEKEKNATRNYLLGLDNSDKTFKFHVFAALTKMRQIANDPRLVDSEYKGSSEKMDYILAKMESIAKSNHKALIFSSFTKLIDLFTKKCEENKWNYVTLTGRDTQGQRRKSVEQFQNHQDISYFFISLKAGGVGLNLTAADYVFILDPWWNPFVEKQAIARAHRIGQDKPVSVIRFISKDTIEEKILKLQERKTLLSDSIIEVDTESLSLEREDLAFILD